MIGGSSSTLVGRINSVLAGVLDTPSGVLRNDLFTLHAQLVDLASVTIERSIEDLKYIIDGSADAASIQSKLGTPTLNGASSDLKSVIGGGSETSIAERLGDPVTGGAGLAAVIRGGGASCGHLNCDDFNNATDLKGQLQAFLTTINNGGTVPPGTYNSLAEVLSAVQPPN
jgi:hypothetical protein